MHKRIDFTGKIFGIIKVNRFLGKKISSSKTCSVWEVECTNCGYISCKVASQIKGLNSCNRCSGMPKGESGLNELFRMYSSSAKRRCMNFELTKEQFKIITNQNCFFCGIEPKQVMRCGSARARKIASAWGFYTYNGIDRFNNNLGYILSNCVPCCGECNKMKFNKTYEEHMNHIERLVNFQIKNRKKEVHQEFSLFVL